MIRSATQRLMRSLLAVALAYAMLLQGTFLPAQASARLAMASTLPAGILTLCSGSQVQDDSSQDAAGHHITAQSSCCAWSVSAGLDLFVPPSLPATVVTYRFESDRRTAAILAPWREPPFIDVRAHGSRAPPVLAL